MWIWAPPRQAGPSDTAIRTPSDFSRALLAALGEPNTGANVQAIDAWQAAEGGFVHLNPLNTTQTAAGSTVWNSVGVKSYPDWKTAIRATAQTLKNGQYRGILAALKAGNNALAVAHAVGASPWGTGDFSRFVGQRYDPGISGADVQVVDAMVGKAQSSGLTYLVVLLGSTDGNFNQQTFLDAFLPSAHAANIRVYGADVPSLANPQADVARALSEITYTTPDQDRIDGLVADLEAGPGGQVNPASAQSYGGGLRAAVGPDFPLVAAVPAPPVPAPLAGPGYPYPQVVSPFDAVAIMDPSAGPGRADLGAAIDALAPLGKPLIPVDQTPTVSRLSGPQTAPPSPAVAAADPATSVAALAQVDRDPGTAKPRAGQPPLPPGLLSPPPGPDPVRDQVLSFVNVADSMKAVSVAFWSWETADPAVFDAMRDAPQFTLPVGAARMSPNQVRNWQTLLTGLGFPAPLSGQWDAQTTAAVKAYQQAAAVPVTGTIDDATRTDTLTPFPPPIPAALLASSLGVPNGVAGPAGAGSPRAEAAVAWAMKQLGTPYVYGGESPRRGFDCSGLTQAAYAAGGIPLPRGAHDQFNAGPHVPPGTPLAPGDLLFFGTPSNIHHVGIYLGGNQMIDAPHTGAAVRIENYHWSDYAGATRPAG